MSNRTNTFRWILFLSLAFIAFLERVVFDFGPNIELVTLSMLLASAYLGSSFSILLVLIVLFLSDIVLGTTSIFLFTWTGFLIPAFVSSRLFSNMQRRRLQGGFPVLFGSVLGFSSNLFFFTWTNFGVWLLDVWGMYPRDLSGLLLSYIHGLPFLKLQLLSTLVFVPIGFAAVEVVRALALQLKGDRALLRELLRRAGLFSSS